MIDEIERRMREFELKDAEFRRRKLECEVRQQCFAAQVSFEMSRSIRSLMDAESATYEPFILTC